MNNLYGTFLLQVPATDPSSISLSPLDPNISLQKLGLHEDYSQPYAQPIKVTFHVDLLNQKLITVNLLYKYHY